MSNRGRQNVASYLALDYGLDWRTGADWFEHHLLDYVRGVGGWGFRLLGREGWDAQAYARREAHALRRARGPP